MPLNIEAAWCKPISLKQADGVYVCPNLNELPTDHGIYVFGRKHGEKAVPLYIGRAENLRVRIKQQMDSVHLMRGIQKAPSGARFLIYCVPTKRQRHMAANVIEVLEDGLILHALGEGHQLLNKQGTLRPSHKIEFIGNRTSEQISGRLIRLGVKAL